MAEFAVVGAVVVETRDRRLTLTLAGIDPIKGSSKTGLPAWQPEELLVSYRYEDSRWHSRDYAMLRGHTLDGVTGIAIPVGEHDDQWTWVGALIDHYLPKD